MVEVSLSSSDPRLPSVSLDILRGAKKLGAQTIVYTASRQAYAQMPAGMVDHWVVCDTRNADDLAKAAKTVAPDCLVGVSDLFVDTANTAALALGLPANANSAAFARDKAAVRRALDEAHVPNLAWAVVDCAEDNCSVPAGVALPAITKPVDGSASWDISRVDSESELRAAVQRHRARSTYGRGVVPAGRLLIEQEVPGQLYSVEGFRYAGTTEIWGYTDRVLSAPPDYIELALSFGLDEPEPGLGAYVRRVLDATNFTYGVFHVEVMSTPSGPMLIEVNPRPMGHGAHQCINALSDQPWGDEIARRYLGLNPTIHIRDGAASVAHQMAEHSGTIRCIDGVENARHGTGVVTVNVNKKAGDTLTVTHSNSDSIAHTVATGPDRAEATRRGFDAVRQIRFTLDAANGAA
jgi:biotin carboxylase